MAATNRSRKGESAEATAYERERAAKFGEWQKSARELKGWLMADLARYAEYSFTRVRALDTDGMGGIDAAGGYTSPTQKYVEAISRATGADFDEGMSFTRYASTKEAPLSKSDSEERVYKRLVGLISEDPDPETAALEVEAFFQARRQLRKKR